MQNFFVRSMSKAFTATLLSTITSIAIAAPLAATDDYDWVVMETPVDPATYKYDCHNDYKYETYDALQNCLYNLREDADNALSKQWNISDKVFRERNAIYIKVANRKNPLVFVDYSSPYEEDFNPYYSLQDYDKSRKLLTIHQRFYEGESLTVVNLVTGFWQDFSLRKLSISPDMRYIVGFESEMGATEHVNILERQDSGYYEGYYKQVYSSSDDSKNYDNHKKFYQADKAQQVYDSETFTWVNDDKFYADSFYKLNEADSAAFRVRYTFIKNASTDKWQLYEGSR